MSTADISRTAHDEAEQELFCEYLDAYPPKENASDEELKERLRLAAEYARNKIGPPGTEPA